LSLAQLGEGVLNQDSIDGLKAIGGVTSLLAAGGLYYLVLAHESRRIVTLRGLAGRGLM